MASEPIIAPEPHSMTERIGSALDGRSPVGTEMEAIFAPLPRPAATVGTDIPKPAARMQARGGGFRWWLALVAAVALAALIGSLAFLILSMRTPHSRQHTGTIPTPARGATPLASSLSIAAPAKNEVPPAPLPVAKARRPSAEREARTSAQPAYYRHCPRRAHAAWCLRGSVLAADRELRSAYVAAERAGVDRRTLLDIRSDWKRLRGRANKDPQALIRGFAVLAQELRTETRRAGR